jgi:Mn2+/Fe2+ NRAMP family transporter
LNERQKCQKNLRSDRDFSNFIAYAIIVTAAATLHAHGVDETSVQAAEAVRPVACRLAETIFALGVVGIGLLSVPVLARVPDLWGRRGANWPTGLAHRQMEAKGLLRRGLQLDRGWNITNFTPVDPIRALYWSAVVNGVVAVPVMAIMMWLAGAPRVMGDVVISRWAKALGWTATVFMAAAVVAMLATS